MSQLGWIAGPLAMLLFASVTFVSAFSLCHCYRSPDPGPKRNPSYLEAVRTILGLLISWWQILICGRPSESLKRVAAAILAAHD